MSSTTTQDLRPTAEAKLPDLIAILGTPIFDQCAPDEQRILLAVLERLAAEHYVRWADGLSDPSQKQGFLACAAREESIADVVEGLEPRARQIAQDLWARFPHMRTLYAETMQKLDRTEQWTVQSAGEHGGAELLRSFAEAEQNPDRRAKLLACSAKDEENSRFLAETLGAMGAR